METDTTDLIARARAGDHNAFRDLVQGHSHELQVHCYRILGSLRGAEDALQEFANSRAFARARAKIRCCSTSPDYAERENLEKVLAGWNAETPVPACARWP